MATRTISVAGGNYNATAAWDEGAVPTSSDDVVCRADGTSGNLTVTAAAAAKTVNLTNGSGYSGVLTLNTSQTLTVSGSVTLAAGMTYSGAGTLVMATTGTLTSNGVTISGGLTMNNITLTLADAAVVTGLFTANNGDTQVLNGSTLTLNGSITVARRTSGTTAVTIAGTGTWTGTTNSGRYWSNPITINTAGTITFAATGPTVGGNTVTYTAGTLVVTGSTVYIVGSTTFAGSWPNLENVRFDNSATWTIQAAMTITGKLTIGDNVTMSGNYALSIGQLEIVDGNYTFTRVNSPTITTIKCYATRVLALGGAFDQTCTNLYIEAGAGLKLPDGKTLTITTDFKANGSTATTTLLSSTTATQTSYLVYQGTRAALSLFRLQVTDISASCTNLDKLYVFEAGTLTRVTNVVDFNLASFKGRVGW